MNEKLKNILPGEIFFLKKDNLIFTCYSIDIEYRKCFGVDEERSIIVLFTESDIINDNHKTLGKIYPWVLSNNHKEKKFINLGLKYGFYFSEKQIQTLPGVEIKRKFSLNKEKTAKKILDELI